MGNVKQNLTIINSFELFFFIFKLCVKIYYVAAGGAVVVISLAWVQGPHYVALNVGVESMTNQYPLITTVALAVRKLDLEEHAAALDLFAAHHNGLGHSQTKRNLQRQKKLIKIEHDCYSFLNLRCSF